MWVIRDWELSEERLFIVIYKSNVKFAFLNYFYKYKMYTDV